MSSLSMTSRCGTPNTALPCRAFLRAPRAIASGCARCWRDCRTIAWLKCACAGRWRSRTGRLSRPTWLLASATITVSSPPTSWVAITASTTARWCCARRRSSCSRCRRCAVSRNCTITMSLTWPTRNGTRCYRRARVRNSRKRWRRSLTSRAGTGWRSMPRAVPAPGTSSTSVFRSPIRTPSPAMPRSPGCRPPS